MSGAPPARRTLEVPFDDGTIPGAIHVHTNRSDGLSGTDEIAQAAARAGLKFVILTDHGDGTRAPDPPIYRSGVLCLDAVEISTNEGHYLALDMPAAPYPLGGSARGVVEDVRRLGGFGVIAHPSSPKIDLSWRHPNALADGVEVMNPDTSWRLKVRDTGWRTRWTIARTLLGYPLRPAETIAHLFAGTALDADQLDPLLRARRLVLISGADAHARISLRDAGDGDNRFALPLPSYETSFRALSVRVRPVRPLSGEAVHDATTIFQALRRGHVYNAVDGLASPPAFLVTATNGRGSANEGDALEADGPVTLNVRTNAPSSFVARVLRNGDVMSSVQDRAEFSYVSEEPTGIFRVEIEAPSTEGALPWVVSNPIFVGIPAPVEDLRPPAAVASQPIFDGSTDRMWRTEVDASSLAVLDVARTLTGAELRLRYGLSGGTPRGQYASLGVELPNGAAPFDRVTFTARAERPQRLIVQFQVLGRAEGWQHSVYLDDVSRAHTIRFADVMPIQPSARPVPDATDIHDILFVVDTTHARPGAVGRIWISKAALER